MKKEQLGELILESQEQLYRVAKTMLRNDEDCADAIQNSIVNAFSKLHTLNSYLGGVSHETMKEFLDTLE